jgi:hypothetical protein
MMGLYYNYDLEQCNWLFKQGVRPCGCDTNNKTGNTFIVFSLSKKYRQAEKRYNTEIKNKLN